MTHIKIISKPVCTYKRKPKKRRLEHLAVLKGKQREIIERKRTR